MKTVGLCTHFTEADDWAFEYAFKLAQTHRHQLNICHWLASPYRVRRDVVYSDLFTLQETVPITSALLNRLELQLREYYEPRLGDFTDVAFKLCEGAYQVELVRCLRQHILDLVVIGHQAPPVEPVPDEQSLEEFALKLPYPVVIVGPAGPETFLLNSTALEIVEELDLPDGSWRALAGNASVSWRVIQPV